MSSFLIFITTLGIALNSFALGSGGTSSGDYQTSLFLVNNNRNYAFYNPARLSFIQQSDVYIQRAPLFENTNFYLGACNYIMGTNAAASFNWSYIGIDDIPEWTDTGNHLVKSYHDATASYSLSYAYRVLPFLALGTTAKLVQRSFYTASGYGFGMDMGIALLPSQFRYFDDMIFDFNIQNVVSPQIALDFGPPYSSYTESWSKNLRSSLTFSSKGGRLDLGFAVNVLNFIPSAHIPQASRRFVFDYNLTFRLARTITVTAGYNNQTIRLGWILGFKQLSDIALMTTINDFLGTQTHLAATQRFGNTRNDNYLIALARGREGAADALLVEGLTLYESGMYLEALFCFKELTFLFPHHANVDHFLYLRATAYNKLGLQHAALGSFKQVLQKHPQSTFTPLALMESAQLYSEMNVTGELNATYQQLATEFSATPERAAVAFSLGRHLRSLGADSNAIDFFNTVPETSIYFQIARYHMAVSFIKLNETADAIKSLHAIIADTLSGNESLIDMHIASRAALGHLAYERGALDTALQWYAEVPSHADEYVGVKLARAYILFNKAAYTAATDSFQHFVKSTTAGSSLFHEASFMAAHSQYLATDYRGALKGFKQYITLAMSDSLSLLSDTTGLGTTALRLYKSIQEITIKRIPEFEKKLQHRAYYRPLSSKEMHVFQGYKDSLRVYKKSLKNIQRKISLKDVKGRWLASAHEMAMKASRVLIELRYQAIYDTYDKKILQLEKKLFELLPTLPEDVSAKEVLNSKSNNTTIPLNTPPGSQKNNMEE